ncbi:MAG: hypothetical protein E6R14_08010, partial [Thermomicrobiales bacterium]
CGTSQLPDALTHIDLLQTMIDQGFVVAITDYPGIGTPGISPYLVGKVEGQTVLDSVRAACRLLRHQRIFIVGSYNRDSTIHIFAPPNRADVRNATYPDRPWRLLESATLPMVERGCADRHGSPCFYLSLVFAYVFHRGHRHRSAGGAERQQLDPGRALSAETRTRCAQVLPQAIHRWLLSGDRCQPNRNPRLHDLHIGHKRLQFSQ